VLADLKQDLAKDGVTLLGQLGFANAYALVMPRAKAEAMKIRSIADLTARAPSITIAGDYEFFSRPEWANLRSAYGLAFKTERQMQPDFMYAAVASGEVDLIAGYTSDGLIAKYDLVVLDDPKQAIPPYDAVLLLAPKRANDTKLHIALQPLLDRIDIEAMRAANLQAGSGSTPDVAARALWDRVKPR
jgi:osmoprotectant transport system permease protein